MRTQAYINNPEISATLAENIVTVEAHNLPPITARAEYYYERSVNLIFSKYADKAEVYVGEALKYTIEVTNNGDSEAAELVIKDVYPKQTFLMSVKSDTGVFSIVNGAIIWSINTLGQHKTASATIIVKPFMRGVIKNEAWLTAKNYNPSPGSNHCEVLTTVLNTKTRGIDFF